MRVRDVDFGVTVGEERPPKRRERLRQGGDPGAGKLPARGGKRPFVHRRAEPDVGKEEKRTGGRGRPRSAAKDDRCDQRRDEDAAEERVEDEDPVERVTMPRERRKEHRSVRRDPVKQNVADDPDQRGEPQKRKLRPAREQLRDRGDPRGKERREEKGMRDAPVELQIAECVMESEPRSGQEERVAVRKHRGDGTHRGGGSRRLLRGRPSEQRAGQAVGERVHAADATMGRAEERSRRRQLARRAVLGSSRSLRQAPSRRRARPAVASCPCALLGQVFSQEGFSLNADGLSRPRTRTLLSGGACDSVSARDHTLGSLGERRGAGATAGMSRGKGESA